MKKNNCVFQMSFVLLIALFALNQTAHASAYHVQEPNYQDSAKDMLNPTSQIENENADSLSEWGRSASQVRAEKISLAKPVSPIDESSFPSDPGRAPASVREPAAMEATASERTKPLPSAKTMVRELRMKKAYQEMSLIVNDLGFFPSVLFATQGIPVRLFVTGASLKSQCIIIDDFGVRRQIRANKVEEIIFTPDQSGKFAFNCPMNGARGALVVKELELDRIPAASPVNMTMAPMPVQQPVQYYPPNNGNEGSTSGKILDSDFGPEFRQP